VPSYSDLRKLSVEQFNSFKITHFEFYDLTKSNPDANWSRRISFRLYTSTSEKSEVSGFYTWANAPEAH